jgi:hypothetical protein
MCGFPFCPFFLPLDLGSAGIWDSAPVGIPCSSPITQRRGRRRKEKKALLSYKFGATFPLDRITRQLGHFPSSGHS